MLDRGKILGFVTGERVPAIPEPVVLGYFAALGVSVVSFWIILLLLALTTSIWSAVTAGSPEVGGLFLWTLLTVIAFIPFSLIALPFAFVYTILPFVFFCSIAGVFKFKNLIYFVVSGALIGLAASAGFVFTVSGIAAGMGAIRRPDYFDQWYIMYVMYPCGALGGLTYWWVAIKRPSRDAPSRQPQPEQS